MEITLAKSDSSSGGTVEIKVHGEYYITDSQIPDNLLGVSWG
jgi:hypothetical protein